MQLISSLVRTRTIASVACIAIFISLNCGMAQSESISTHINPTGTTSVSLHQRAGYLAPKASFLGTIYHAMGEPFYLERDDLALIDVGANRDLKVGDHLTIFRILPALNNPHTGTNEGQPIRIMGDATVTKVNDTTAMIRITLAFDEIEVGHRVERFGVLPPQATPTDGPTRTRLIDSSDTPSGSILTSRDNRLVISQGDIVFIDQGTQDGVTQGDQFRILENARMAHHPDTSRTMPVPRQTIGELTIVDVQERSATAQITQSLREFETGTLVQFAALDHSSSSQVAGQLTNLSNTESLAMQIPPCFEQARLAIRAAEDTAQPSSNLVAARHLLSDAKATFEQAQDLMEQGQRDRALQLLRAVQSDCLTAQQLATQSDAALANRNLPADERYTVQPGDTLWGIAAQPTLYQNPWLWPMIYQANRNRINDPDLIYPKQELTVPRSYSSEAANSALHRAGTRGPWRLGDGPDTYILEGAQP